MKARSLIQLMAGSALGFTVTAPAWAEPGGDGLDPGDIIVTARRVEERLQDVPISITVYNQEALTTRNIVSPADLATYTPSLTVNQRYGPEKSSFVIRGFTQESNTSPSVGVYFADVVAPRAQAGTSSGNGSAAGQLFDLQNVQVLKGPQGTLFGRNTTGGAVLLTPRKPTGDLEGYVEASTGNFDMWRLQAVLNVPLAETFKIRLGFDRNKRDGYMRNLSGTRSPDLNDSNYFAARLGVVADLTPDLENYSLFSYSNSFSKGFGARIVGCLYDGVVPGFSLSTGQRRTAQMGCNQLNRQTDRGDSMLDVESNHPDPRLEIRQWQAINTTTWLASDTLTIKNIVSYSEFRESSAFSLSGDNFTIPNPAPAGVNPALAGQPFWHIHLYPAPGEDNVSQSTFTEELQFQGNALDGDLNWQAGAYLEVSKPLGWSNGYTPQFVYCADLSTFECTNPFGIGNITESPYRTSWNNKGFYTQATYAFSEKWSMTGGIRYTIDKMRSIGENRRVIPSPVPGGAFTYRCNDPRLTGDASVRPNCRADISRKWEKPTWLIGVEYKPAPDMMLYAKWARGYRQGGTILTNIGLESWEPEKVDAYEFGAKTTFNTGSVRGNFNLAGFYNDFTDQQITANLTPKPDSGVPGGNAIVNAGKSRIWGIETDASVTLSDNLRLDAAYTYLNTKLVDINIPVLPPESPFSAVRPTAARGLPLALSPKHRLTASATYTLPLDESVGEVSIGATYVYTSSQFSSRASEFITLTDGSKVATADAIGINPGFLPSNHLVNLNVNWNNVFGRPIDAGFFMTNLTDEIYPVSATNSLATAGYEAQIFGAPRMWGFRLKYRFGS